MKIINATADSIALYDIGYDKNGGPPGRAKNQARYIPSGLTGGNPDPAKAIQLIETDEVLMSAAYGQISKFVGSGKMVILSTGEDVAVSVSVTKSSPTNTQVFYNDYVFGRPVNITTLTVTPNTPPAPGNVLNFLFGKNNTTQATVQEPGAPTAALAGLGTGLVTFGSHLYKVTFVTAAGETMGGTASSAVFVIGAPLTAPTAALAGLGAGNVDNGTHSYVITFVHAGGETAGSPASNVITTTGLDGQVALTAIPVGPTGVTARKVYRTVAGDTGNYKLVGTIANNTATIFADNIADGTLGADAPTTAEDSQVALTAIPTGNAGIVTARKIYRTTAGGSTYKLLATLSDNTTVIYTDNIADGSLGANAPTSNTTGTEYQYTSNDTGAKTFDVSGMIFGTTPSNAWDDNDLLDLALGLSSNTTGISSIKVDVGYTEQD